jgi:hypothetical protein
MNIEWQVDDLKARRVRVTGCSGCVNQGRNDKLTNLRTYRILD